MRERERERKGERERQRYRETERAKAKREKRKRECVCVSVSESEKGSVPSWPAPVRRKSFSRSSSLFTGFGRVAFIPFRKHSSTCVLRVDG